MNEFYPVWSAITEAKLRALKFEAKRWLGTVENGGDNNGEIVNLFQRAVDGKATREPWCMCFVQYCVKKVDEAFDSKYQQTLKHKTLLYPSEHCMTTYNKTDKILRIETPVIGSLILWRYYKADGTKTESGHVEIVTNRDYSEMYKQDTHVETVGGNTSDSSGVEREGDGVFIKRRDYAKKTGRMRVEGILLPWSYDELA